MKANEYADKRLKSGFGNDRADDRDTESKRWDDAKLRGSIGVEKANELIASIDKLKGTR